MKLKDFLTEQKKKTIVFAFGRFNPPTVGHELLVNKVLDTAKASKADHVIYASRSQDPKKNPLDVKTKVSYLKKMFKGGKFVAASDEVRTFMEVAKELSEQGYKDIVMVAGSDRVPEYQKLLDKYNGQDFHFDTVKVVSAGERDPDADGASGMSASKMREAAHKNDFKSFRQGVPASLNDREAKELMLRVRRGMSIKEYIELPVDALFENELLSEGVHDKGIFKAVFLAGGPGSGKDYVLDNTLSGHGLTEINSDKALEFLMDKKNLDKTMPASEADARDVVRGQAKSMTELRQRLALLGRNGLIINGTGDDAEKIKKIKSRLEEIGYDTHMVVVNTADEVSAQRNLERGQRGGRTVPEDIRKKKWDSVQKARTELATLFGNNYTEFDNSEDLRSAKPEVVKAKKDEMLNIFKSVKAFVSKPPEHENAKAWVAQELSKKDTLGTSAKGADKTPPHESNAYQQAMHLGLQYMGFGRYGKGGIVTHHSVHDSLVAVQREKIKDVSVPISGSSGTKPAAKPEPKVTIKPVKVKVPNPVKEDIDLEFENFLTEAVTITVKADTAEEAAKAVRLLTNDEGAEEVEEEIQQDTNTFSDLTAQQLLTLGTVFGVHEAHEVKHHPDTLLKDTNGKPKTFMLRRAAAKEAHINGGVVHKAGKGYVIKIKENEDVSSINQSIQEKTTRTSTRSGARILTESRGSTSCSAGCSCESCGGKTTTEGTSRKISITQAKKKYKEKINEIDMGIEPGMSMASSGENLTRGSTIKNKQKGMLELTGDETTMSTGDEKENELKRVGISLSSFKSKKVV
jgi:nicotinic acid mononucleotide adenylyltransferase/chloramphenicol 3-O-phosphotransferase